MEQSLTIHDYKHIEMRRNLNISKDWVRVKSFWGHSNPCPQDTEHYVRDRLCCVEKAMKYN